MTASPPPQPYRPPPPSRRQVLTATAAASAVLALSGGTANAASGAPRAAASEAAAAPPSLAPLPPGDVRLLDSPFRDNMRRTCAYLQFVDSDRLLHTFRLNVGPAVGGASPAVAGRRPDVQLRGHTTGHLLSALAQAHANTGEEAYAAKARHVVAELAEMPGRVAGRRIPPGLSVGLPGGRSSTSWRRAASPGRRTTRCTRSWPGCSTSTASAATGRRSTYCSPWPPGSTRRTAALAVRPDAGASWSVEFGGMNEVLTDLFLVTRDPRTW